jgi:hypothetical protein
VATPISVSCVLLLVLLQADLPSLGEEGEVEAGSQPMSGAGAVKVNTWVARNRLIIIMVSV